MKLNYKFFLGEKLGMMTFFRNDEALPATIIKASPCVVTNLKFKQKDGYPAVQLGYGEKKKVKKPILGQVKNLGKFKVIKEFRLPEDPNDLEIGQKLDLSIFEVGEKINVTSISKGKGFQGVVKRWGFREGPRTHGQTTKLRHPGSIGATTPQRVIKGHKMAGRTGNKRVTVRNLEILSLDPQKNIMLVKGSIPGSKNSLVEIRSANLTRKGNKR